jgi:type II secretory pathway pseudopilin PulG
MDSNPTPIKPKPIGPRHGVSGFSLAELVITLGVVAILAAIVLTGTPVLQGGGQKAQQNVAIVKDTAMQVAMAYKSFLKYGYRSTGVTVTLADVGSPVRTQITSSTSFAYGFKPGDSIRLVKTDGTRLDLVVNTIVNGTTLTTTRAWSSSENGNYIAEDRIDGLTHFWHIAPHLNYIKYDQTSNLSSVPTGETPLDVCSGSTPCFQLNNGAWLQYNYNWFSTLASDGKWGPLNYIVLAVDPDGTGNSAGKVSLILFANGTIITGNTGVSPPLTGAVTDSSPLSIVANPGWLTVANFEK